jgi:hypothetical protein
MKGIPIFQWMGLTLFGGLALLPSIIHLAWLAVPVTHPSAALGPGVAGFLLAARLCRTRANFTLMGTLVTTLIWTANWMMMAGHHCCSGM